MNPESQEPVRQEQLKELIDVYNYLQRECDEHRKLQAIADDGTEVGRITDAYHDGQAEAYYDAAAKLLKWSAAQDV